MTCPRCRRPVNPWPLKRNDVCSPRDWAMCIRTWENIERQVKRQAMKDTLR